MRSTPGSAVGEASGLPPLLEVQDLQTSLRRGGTEVPVVDGVSFAIDAGKTLAIVGESGCGKSLTALSLMRLLPEGQLRTTGGRVLFEGRNLLAADEPAMASLRGRRLAMIFQEPMASLNPVRAIGRHVTEPLLVHGRAHGQAARARAIEMLRLVRIPDPELRFDEFPHRFSGGMRQRVMIAAALICEPSLLIADEPTTALDVTIQSQILALLRSLQARLGLAILFISHDLAVVSEIAHKVAVMYAGRIVESGPVAEVLSAPAHPYTKGLLGARPRPQRRHGAHRERLVEIPGTVPPPGALPQGCAFAPRCPWALDACRHAPPELAPLGGDRRAACIRAAEVMAGP
jgi:peptide/nickel transport system ATP-binding protein